MDFSSTTLLDIRSHARLLGPSTLKRRHVYHNTEPPHTLRATRIEMRNARLRTMILMRRHLFLKDITHIPTRMLLLRDRKRPLHPLTMI